MAINIPSIQPLQPFEVPDYGTQISRLARGADALARAMASASRYRASSGGGTVETLSNGQQINVPGGDKDTRARNRAAILNGMALRVIEGNPALKEAFASIDPNASYEKQDAALKRIETDILPTAGANQPAEVIEALASIVATQRKRVNALGSKIESSDGMSAIGDMLGARLRTYAEGIRSFIQDDTEAEKQQSGERINKIIQDTIDSNPYLRNQQLLEAEGVSMLDRAMSGTGSVLTNIGTTIAEQGTDMAADILLPVVGGAIGSLAGPGGALGGAIAGHTLATGLSGVASRADYIARVASDPNLTPEQRRAALSDAATAGALGTGLATGFAGGFIGKGARLLNGARRAITGNAAEQATRQVGRGIRSYITRDLPEMAAEGAALAGLEQGAQNAIIAASSGADVPLSQDVGQAALLGGLTGGLFAVPRNIARGPRPDTNATRTQVTDAPAAEESGTPQNNSAGGEGLDDETLGRFSAMSQRTKAAWRESQKDVTYDSALRDWEQNGGTAADFDTWLEWTRTVKGDGFISKKIYSKLKRGSSQSQAAATVDPETKLRNFQTAVSSENADYGTLIQSYLTDADNAASIAPNQMESILGNAEAMAKYSEAFDLHGTDWAIRKFDEYYASRDRDVPNLTAMLAPYNDWLSRAPLDEQRKRLTEIVNTISTDILNGGLHAKGQTGGETGDTSRQTTSVGQPDGTGARAVGGADTTVSSRMAADTEADTSISPDAGAEPTPRIDRAAQGAGIGGSAIQSVRPNQGTEVDAQQARVGRTAGSTSDDGTTNRQPTSGGAEQNPSAGVDGDAGIRDSSVDTDAASTGRSDIPDSDAGMSPAEPPARTPEVLRNVDNTESMFDGPSEDISALRSRVLGAESLDKKQLDILQRNLGKGDATQLSDKLNGLLWREALNRDARDIMRTFPKRDAAILQNLRDAGIAEAEPLPELPRTLIDRAVLARQNNLDIKPDELAESVQKPREALWRSAIHVVCSI